MSYSFEISQTGKAARKLFPHGHGNDKDFHNDRVLRVNGYACNHVYLVTKR